MCSTEAGGLFHYFDLDNLPDYEPLDVTIQLFKKDEEAALLKVLSFDISDVFDHHQWPELSQCLSNSLLRGEENINRLSLLAHIRLLKAFSSQQAMDVIRSILSFIMQIWSCDSLSVVDIHMLTDCDLSVLSSLQYMSLSAFKLVIDDISKHFLAAASKYTESALAALFMILRNGKAILIEGTQTLHVPIIYFLSKIDSFNIRFVDSFLQKWHAYSLFSHALHSGFLNFILRLLSASVAAINADIADDLMSIDSAAGRCANKRPRKTEKASPAHSHMSLSVRLFTLTSSIAFDFLSRMEPCEQRFVLADCREGALAESGESVLEAAVGSRSSDVSTTSAAIPLPIIEDIPGSNKLFSQVCGCRSFIELARSQVDHSLLSSESSSCAVSTLLSQASHTLNIATDLVCKETFKYKDLCMMGCGDAFICILDSLQGRSRIAIDLETRLCILRDYLVFVDGYWRTRVEKDRAQMLLSALVETGLCGIVQHSLVQVESSQLLEISSIAEAAFTLLTNICSSEDNEEKWRDKEFLYRLYTIYITAMHGGVAAWDGQEDVSDFPHGLLTKLVCELTIIADELDLQGREETDVAVNVQCMNIGGCTMGTSVFDTAIHFVIACLQSTSVIHHMKRFCSDSFGRLVDALVAVLCYDRLFTPVLHGVEEAAMEVCAVDSCFVADTVLFAVHECPAEWLSDRFAMRILSVALEKELSGPYVWDVSSITADDGEVNGVFLYPFLRLLIGITIFIRPPLNMKDHGDSYSDRDNRTTLSGVDCVIQSILIEACPSILQCRAFDCELPSTANILACLLKNAFDVEIATEAFWPILLRVFYAALGDELFCERVAISLRASVDLIPKKALGAVCIEDTLLRAAVVAVRISTEPLQPLFLRQPLRQADAEIKKVAARQFESIVSAMDKWMQEGDLVAVSEKYSRP